MGALKDLWHSERGIVAIALIAACTVMAALSSITTDQWVDYTTWIFLTYASTKTVTGVAAILKSPEPRPLDSPDIVDKKFDWLMSMLAQLSKPGTPPQPEPATEPAKDPTP